MLDKETFVYFSKEELEEVALESTRSIEIDEFVEKSEIDPRYLIRPYYLRPDGKIGHDCQSAFKRWKPMGVKVRRLFTVVSICVRCSRGGSATGENWCATDLSFITETTPSTFGVRSEACH
jgi:hypothetical protein